MQNNTLNNNFNNNNNSLNYNFSKKPLNLENNLESNVENNNTDTSIHSNNHSIINNSDNFDNSENRLLATAPTSSLAHKQYCLNTNAVRIEKREGALYSWIYENQRE